MKKIILFLIVAMMIFTCFSPLLVYANENTEEGVDHISNAVTYSCEYDSDLGVIKISGTMSHDVMIKYKDYSIAIYQIHPGKSIQDILNNKEIQPVAKSAISIKFQFSFKAEKITDKFSKYAVFLYSPKGERILANSPQYVEISPSNNTNNKNNRYFKGVLASNTTAVFDVNPGTVIIPVYLNSVVSNIPKGYLHQSGFAKMYFDKSYIDSLDAKIKAVSASGGQVYLQLLLPSGTTKWEFLNESVLGAEYVMPNIYADDVLIFLDSCMAFLADRYDTEAGDISGIIIGKQVDKANIYNACGIDSLDEYAKAYSTYVAVTAISALSVNPKLNIVIPFSDVNCYSTVIEKLEGFDTSALLEAISSEFNNSFSFDFSFITLIESNALPFEFDSTLTLVVPKEEPNRLTANNIAVYYEHIRKLKCKYKNVSTNFMYIWEAPYELSGSKLELSYAYLYYKLVNQAGLLSFVISFDQNRNFSDAKSTIKYIDETSSLDVTSQALKAEGFASWNELIDGLTPESFVTHKRFTGSSVNVSIMNSTGIFDYFAFSEKSSIQNWHRGIYCSEITWENHEKLGSAMKVNISSPLLNSEFGEIYYIYDQPENLIYTPYLSFEVAAENIADKNAIYELKISLISDNDYIETSYSVHGDEITQVAFDLNNYNINNTIKGIKISIRRIAGSENNFSLWIKNIRGYSNEKSSEELENLIYEERMKLMNQVQGEDADDSSGTIKLGFVFGVLFAIIGVGIGLFMSFRRETVDPNNKL